MYSYGDDQAILDYILAQKDVDWDLVFDYATGRNKRDAYPTLDFNLPVVYHVLNKVGVKVLSKVCCLVLWNTSQVRKMMALP